MPRGKKKAVVDTTSMRDIPKTGRVSTMQNIFITKIQVNKVRHLTNVNIFLSETERQHLILTGKNGSGKTSLLAAIRDFVIEHQYRTIENQETGQVLHELIRANQRRDKELMGISVEFSGGISNLFGATFAYLSAERSSMLVPKAIEPIEEWGKTYISRNASKDFLKYILILYVQYLSAKDTGKSSTEIEQYQAWFERFTQALRDIYGCQELELKPDMKNLVFNVALPGREPFGLHEMSDGYKAFLEILMELLMRMESGSGDVDYNQSAIVLIDEIETHLHVELQKRALPFLTQMFPCVQFIVATHSPFIITSLANAVVYDLEKHEILDNPSYYSYESVVESFLDANMYSEVMRRQLNRYRELCFKERTLEENEEFLRTKTELELMAPASKELFIEFREIEQKRRGGKHD